VPNLSEAYPVSPDSSRTVLVSDTDFVTAAGWAPCGRMTELSDALPKRSRLVAAPGPPGSGGLGLDSQLTTRKVSTQRPRPTVVRRRADSVGSWKTAGSEANTGTSRKPTRPSYRRPYSDSEPRGNSRCSGVFPKSGRSNDLARQVPGNPRHGRRQSIQSRQRPKPDDLARRNPAATCG